MILTALGVDLEGSREVLAFRACAEEDKDGWSCLLQDLRTRGVSHIDLIVTDGHDGLLAAVSSLFPATPRQRCLVHKQRNVMNAIPKREQQEVAAELAGIFKQENKEAALLNLACAGYLGHLFTKLESRASTIALISLYWLLSPSVRKNGSLAVANALILISFLLERCNPNRGRSKEHLFCTCQQQTTIKKLASETGFLSPLHVLHTQRMFRTKLGED